MRKYFCRKHYDCTYTTRKQTIKNGDVATLFEIRKHTNGEKEKVQYAVINEKTNQVVAMDLL